MDRVTGGTGFLGRVLVRRLLEQGERVRVVGRHRGRLMALREAGCEVLLGDLREPAVAFRAVEGCDRIFHLAGVRRAVDGLRFWRANVAAALALSRAFARKGRGRLVALSSLAAAGPCPPGVPLEEQAVPAPVNLYGRSKLAGEQAVRTLPEPLSWVVLRPCLAYGPEGAETLELFREVASGRIRAPRPGQMLSLVHVEDLARALILCGSRPEAHRKVYFLAGTPDMTFSEIAALAGRALGRGVEVVELGVLGLWARAARAWLGLLLGARPGQFTPDRMRELEQPAWQCSPARIRRELGWEPMSSHGEGFEQVAAWCRRAGLLPRASA